MNDGHILIYINKKLQHFLVTKNERDRVNEESKRETERKRKRERERETD